MLHSIFQFNFTTMLFLLLLYLAIFLINVTQTKVIPLS